MEERTQAVDHENTQQDGEKKSKEGLAVRPAIKTNGPLAREKAVNGNMQRRRVARKTVSEGVLQRKTSADIKSKEASFLANRPRAISNLETARELSLAQEKSVNEKAKDSSTRQQRTSSDSAVTTSSQRQRKSSKTNSNEQINATMINRPSTSKTQEKWAVSRTTSGELLKRKSSLGLLTAGSISSTHGSRKNGEVASSFDSQSERVAMKSRSSSDGDRSGMSLYFSSSLERREIIDKYLKESKPPENSKKADKNSSRVKSKDIKEVENQVQDELKSTRGAMLFMNKLDGDKEREGPKKGWGLLRKKLQEVAMDSQGNDESQGSQGESDVSSKVNDEVQSTEKYLKMLRERLRKCQPADIVASSNVKEITQRKQDVERKRSVVGTGKKNSFFETVLTAHALSKENKANGRPIRKTSLSRINEGSDIIGQSLPDISINTKFKSSPHFRATIQSLEQSDFTTGRNSVE